LGIGLGLNGDPLLFVARIWYAETHRLAAPDAAELVSRAQHGSHRDGGYCCAITAARESPERIVLVAFEEDLPQRPSAVCLVGACRTG
jgi:hypothetical protein